MGIDVIADADVIYMEPVVQPDYTQSRQEKQDEYGLTPAAYQVTRKVMEKAKGDSIVLHSLPRMDELLPEVDNTRHARYWQEAYNGVVMRMALLALVPGRKEGEVVLFCRPRDEQKEVWDGPRAGVEGAVERFLLVEAATTEADAESRPGIKVVQNWIHEFRP